MEGVGVDILEPRMQNCCENCVLTDFAAQPGIAFKAGADDVVGVFHRNLAVGALKVRAESLAAQVVCARKIIAHNQVGVRRGRGLDRAPVVGAFGFAALGHVASLSAQGDAGFLNRGGAFGALDGAAEQWLRLVCA